MQKARGIYYSKAYWGGVILHLKEKCRSPPACLISLYTVCPVKSCSPAPDLFHPQEAVFTGSRPPYPWEASPRPSLTPSRPCLLAPDLSFLVPFWKGFCCDHRKTKKFREYVRWWCGKGDAFPEGPDTHQHSIE